MKKYNPKKGTYVEYLQDIIKTKKKSKKKEEPKEEVEVISLDELNK